MWKLLSSFGRNSPQHYSDHSCFIVYSQPTVQLGSAAKLIDFSQAPLGIDIPGRKNGKKNCCLGKLFNDFICKDVISTETIVSPDPGRLSDALA